VAAPGANVPLLPQIGNDLVQIERKLRPPARPQTLARSNFGQNTIRLARGLDAGDTTKARAAAEREVSLVV
jgi:hypothetical protein